MNEKISLEEIEKKSYKQLNDDGFLEIALGLILFLYSRIWDSSLISGVIVFQLFLMPRILEYAREKYTYPRIGYVKHFDESSETGKGIIVYVVASMLIVAFLILLGYGKITGDLVYQWAPAFIGLSLLGAMLYLNGKSGDKTYLVYAVISVLSGLGFSLYRFQPVHDGIPFYLLFISLSMMIAGVFRFVLFRKKYPVFDEVSVVE
jgi:hypothetical protein